MLPPDTMFFSRSVLCFDDDEEEEEGVGAAIDRTREEMSASV